MRKIGLLAIVLLFSSSLYSQNNRTLSFEQAFSTCLLSNGLVKASEYQIKVKEKEKKAMVGLRSPSFDFNAAYTYMSKDIDLNFNAYKSDVTSFLEESQLPIPPQVAQKLLGADWRYMIQDRSFAVVGFSASMPIFLGGKINTANKIADIELQEAIRQNTSQKSELFTNLVELYFGMSLSMQVVQVRQEVLDGMKVHLNEAVLLEKSGIIASVERLYAQMKVSQAESELQKAKSSLESISTALKSMLAVNENITPTTSIFVVDKIEGLEYYKLLAQENNLSLREIELKKELAKQAVKIEKANFMPQVVAMGGIDVYNYQLTSFAPKWVVGAAVKFNIFNGLNREFNLSAANNQVKRVEAISSQATSDIEALVEKHYNDIVSYLALMESYSHSLNFSKEYLRIKTIAFKQGSIPSSEVVDAVLNLAKTRIERVECAYKFDIAISKLLDACGIKSEFMAFKEAKGYMPVNFEE